MTSVANLKMPPELVRNEHVRDETFVKNTERRDEAAEVAAKESIQDQNARAEQVKAPVNKGMGQFIDKEA